MSYKTILVAVDLGETSADVVRKASAMATTYGAQLHVLHAVEPLSITYGGDIPMDFSSIQDEIYQQADEQLDRFCAELGITEAQRHLVVGRPENEIPETAKALEADLIVVGSHARFGLAVLLGSTADGVLHGAACDVLAIRVKRPD
ncbi:UspA domain protein [Luminiphilus syltensis NOR5-1B]|uniref:Universal stress protein n=1 Tax=Luminiphilus syltensis NOR5-1B TaxID=565045 RepID=B8KYH2_9GAMM|nr:universal stress protein [Luminiphilus syltensis]EED34966.1 UspA domain protein [Luminiphilus syltensis NOR5-1B]